jgi:hypothetical protein
VNGPRLARRFALATVAALACGCGPRLDVGSDVLWTALFEGDSFDEWTAGDAGMSWAFPTPPNLAEPTAERVRSGGFAAKLTVDAPAGSGQANVVLSRAGDVLPPAAYYSVWYYLPRTISVGQYWVIFKFRQREDATQDELFDLDLINLDTGEMSLQLYDHRKGGNVPLDADGPIVPVGRWFQIEAYYRNAQDDTGRLTFWLDGRPILDVANQKMASTPFVEWNVSSIAEDLTPSTAVLYVDDCAISRTRVGPNGVIAD